MKALVGPIIHSLRRFVCSSSKYTAPHLQPPGHSNNGGFFVGSNFCNLMPHARVWSIVRNKAEQIRVKSFHKLCKVFSWRYKVVTFNSLSFIQMIWFMIHTYASFVLLENKPKSSLENNQRGLLSIIPILSIYLTYFRKWFFPLPSFSSTNTVLRFAVCSESANI